MTLGPSLEVRDAFEQALLGRHRGDVTTLPPSVLEQARHAYFVLHRDAHVDVTMFVQELLSQLLPRLNVDAERQRMESRQGIRGKIDWPVTTRRQINAGGDRTVYVTRIAQRTFDTPENRVVRALIARIDESLASLPTSLNDANCRVGTRSGAHHLVGPHVEALERELRRFARERSVRQIPLGTVDDEMLDSAERAKHPAYGQAAILLRRWRSTVLGQDLDGLVRCARSTLILPAIHEGEGHDWIRLAAYCVTRPAAA